jgi:hypothetical protein
MPHISANDHVRPRVEETPPRNRPRAHYCHAARSATPGRIGPSVRSIHYPYFCTLDCLFSARLLLSFLPTILDDSGWYQNSKRDEADRSLVDAACCIVLRVRCRAFSPKPTSWFRRHDPSFRCVTARRVPIRRKLAGRRPVGKQSFYDRPLSLPYSISSFSSMIVQ